MGMRARTEAGDQDALRCKVREPRPEKEETSLENNSLVHTCLFKTCNVVAVLYKYWEDVTVKLQ